MASNHHCCLQALSSPTIHAWPHLPPPHRRPWGGGSPHRATSTSKTGDCRHAGVLHLLLLLFRCTVELGGRAAVALRSSSSPALDVAGGHGARIRGATAHGCRFP
ncbi:hypothetical protein U9M48_044916 [Paspalum notatum var. saurae]|uniref:Uncharacterized protein n=1 Tax=Paspalum notatum var. saurae TaxID=547442 RepID=A0AAQ3UY35_PASNO